MSANPLDEVDNTYSYDFSSGESQAYGGVNAHKEIGANIWGMVSADGDSNGDVSNTDKNDVWVPEAGQSGYNTGDFNMDSNVDNVDKNDNWIPNSGRGSQVPGSTL